MCSLGSACVVRQYIVVKKWCAAGSKVVFDLPPAAVVHSVAHDPAVLAAVCYEVEGQLRILVVILSTGPAFAPANLHRVTFFEAVARPLVGVRNAFEEDDVVGVDDAGIDVRIHARSAEGDYTRNAIGGQFRESSFIDVGFVVTVDHVVDEVNLADSESALSQPLRHPLQSRDSVSGDHEADGKRVCEHVVLLSQVATICPLWALRSEVSL